MKTNEKLLLTIIGFLIGILIVNSISTALLMVVVDELRNIAASTTETAMTLEKIRSRI